MAKQPSRVQKAIDELNRLADQLAALPPKSPRGFELSRQSGYATVADRFRDVADDLGYVSRRTVEGAVNGVCWTVIKAVDGGAGAEAARNIGKESIRQLQALLARRADPWVIHMRVHNLARNGLPFRSGNVKLALADDAYLQEMQRPGHAVITTMKHTDEDKDVIRGKLREWVNQEFAGRTMAAVEVEALDGEAARRLALDALRETLDLLNYCRSVLPYPVESWVYGDADPMPRLTASLLYRGPHDAPESFSMPFENIGTLGQLDVGLLSGPEAESAGVARLLAIAAKSSRSDVEEKVLNAARVAGAAITRHRRDHAFLLNVIALESLVLGEPRDDVDGPLQYRLGLRCAHAGRYRR